MAESFLCKECKKQYIYKSSQKSEYGRNLILNSSNGIGGLKDQRHICPARLQAGSMADVQRIKKIFMCRRCKKEFSGRFVDCPECFKLICQKCGTFQDWRIDQPVCRCKKCNHPYLDWQEITTYDPESGKYVEKDIIWNPVIIPSADIPPQKTDCETLNYRGYPYGHVYQSGDKKCRICGFNR